MNYNRSSIIRLKTRIPPLNCLNDINLTVHKVLYKTLIEIEEKWTNFIKSKENKDKTVKNYVGSWNVEQWFFLKRNCFFLQIEFSFFTFLSFFFFIADTAFPWGNTNLELGGGSVQIYFTFKIEYQVLHILKKFLVIWNVRIHFKRKQIAQFGVGLNFIAAI